MIAGGRVVALIPARGGSKGVPRKNIRALGGIPVLQWTVEAAKASRYIDRLIVSTDDDEISELGVRLGAEVPFRRPAEIASDTATAAAVVDHALAQLEQAFEYLVYLQPTSPFRSPDDIDGCLERLVDSAADTCVSVTESAVKPEWLFYISPRSTLTPVLGRVAASRRQELQPAYALNGAVYALRVAAFLRMHAFVTDHTIPWVMPADRSVDLDEFRDFDLAEYVLRQKARSVAG